MKTHLLVKDMQDCYSHCYIQIPEVSNCSFVLGDLSTDQHKWT